MMKKQKQYTRFEEESEIVSEPAVAEKVFVGNDFGLGSRDFGLPRTIEEVEAELIEAEKELGDSSQWESLHDFMSEFKQEHDVWLK